MCVTSREQQSEDQGVCDAWVSVPIPMSITCCRVYVGMRQHERRIWKYWRALACFVGLRIVGALAPAGI